MVRWNTHTNFHSCLRLQNIGVSYLYFKKTAIYMDLKSNAKYQVDIFLLRINYKRCL
jgi:hypothetical protein